MTGEPDGQLVRNVARAELARAAEAELCRRFAPRIRLYGLRHLRDDDRARDLVQAVLVVVLEAARAGRIEDPDRVDRYVLGTCRNTVARVREHEARQRPVPAEELEAVAALPARYDIEERALVPCLAALDDRLRTVVLLSFNDEKPAEAIAAILGTSAGNVRVLRHRAIAQLRACLDVGREASA